MLKISAHKMRLKMAYLELLPHLQRSIMVDIFSGNGFLPDGTKPIHC